MAAFGAAVFLAVGVLPGLGAAFDDATWGATVAGAAAAAAIFGAAAALIAAGLAAGFFAAGLSADLGLAGVFGLVAIYVSVVRRTRPLGPDRAKGDWCVAP